MVKNLVAVCCMALALALPASAAERQKPKGLHNPPPPEHATPPRRPVPPPRRPVPPPHAGVTWSHGYWHHGWYGGRLGWWWVVGPSWYYYMGPVWPYWDPWPPREVVVVEQPAPSGPPPAAFWYRCDDPSGYYPYVATCPGGWTAVPVTPPPAPPAPPP